MEAKFSSKPRRLFSQHQEDSNSYYEYDYDIVDSDRTEVSSELFEDISRQSVTPIRPILRRDTSIRKNDHKVTLQQFNDNKLNSTDSELLKTACLAMEKRLSNLSQIMDRTLNSHHETTIIFSDSESSEEDEDNSNIGHNEPEWEDIYREIKKQKKFLLSFLDVQTKTQIINQKMIKRAKKDREITLSRLHTKNSKTVKSMIARSPLKLSKNFNSGRKERHNGRSLLSDKRTSIIRSKNSVNDR